MANVIAREWRILFGNANLTDFAVAIDINALHFLELFYERSQRILRGGQMFFERLDPFLNRIGFSVLAIYQAGLNDFPK
jgi:hypothetical protein